MVVNPAERAIIKTKPTKHPRGIFKFEESVESSPILLQSLGVINFYIDNRQPGKNRIFVRLDIQFVERYVMVIVTLVKPEDVPYGIKNNTKDCVVEVPILKEVVGPGNQALFSWRNP